MISMRTYTFMLYEPKHGRWVRDTVISAPTVKDARKAARLEWPRGEIVRHPKER